MSSATAQAAENLILNVTQEIQIHAPLDTSFEALLEQLGPGADTPDGKAMPMKLEAWPGGGIANWVTAMAISGELCRPSSVRHCSKSAGRCLCPTRLFPIFNTG